MNTSILSSIPVSPQQSGIPRTVEFIYFDFGGGHRSAAVALDTVINKQFPHWNIRFVNLAKDVIQSLDLIHNFSEKYYSEDIYNSLLKREFTYGFTLMLRTMHQIIKVESPSIQKLMRQHWEEKSRPDLVISLIPNFNRPMFQALKDVHPSTPYVTVMTDIADFPPHFWQEKQDQFLICGSDKAVEQARALGYPPERVFQTSGMIIKPHFYNDTGIVDRGSEREKLGLAPDVPTAIVMFGGNGAEVSRKIAGALNSSDFAMQSIVMCGHNKELKRELEGVPACHPVGFTYDRVPYYMALSDLFIGKPGPGSLAEAQKMGLAAIINLSSRTMPQERYNAHWIEDEKLGIVVPHFKHIGDAARDLLTNGKLEEFRNNARRINNRAVFEVPEILQTIMETPESSLPHVQVEKKKPVRFSLKHRKKNRLLQTSGLV